MPNPKDIKISLEPWQLEVLRRSFPEHPEDESASALAKIMLDELLGLFNGTKRYTSLSHQYIEWLQEIYAALLPEEEFRESRLLNLFGFPPGSATYMARILRAKENMKIQEKAIQELGQIFWESYQECKGKLPQGALMKTVKLTIRAFGVWGDIVDSIIRSDRNSPVEQPATTTRGHEFVQCALNLKDVHLLINEFMKQFPAGSAKLNMKTAKPLN